MLNCNSMYHFTYNIFCIDLIEIRWMCLEMCVNKNVTLCVCVGEPQGVRASNGEDVCTDSCQCAEWKHQVRASCYFWPPVFMVHGHSIPTAKDIFSIWLNTSRWLLDSTEGVMLSSKLTSVTVFLVAFWWQRTSSGYGSTLVDGCLTQQRVSCLALSSPQSLCFSLHSDSREHDDELMLNVLRCHLTY